MRCRKVHKKIFLEYLGVEDTSYSTFLKLQSNKESAEKADSLLQFNYFFPTSHEHREHSGDQSFECD